MEAGECMSNKYMTNQDLGVQPSDCSMSGIAIA
jgi:hypothetical protein